MKKTSILDFFKTQTVSPIKCPGCGISILKSKLNEHLDLSCSSSLQLTVSASNELKHDKKSSKTSSLGRKRKIGTSSRLCLKRSKTIPISKQIGRAEVTSDDDVIILDEITHTHPDKNANCDLKAVNKQTDSLSETKPDLSTLENKDSLENGVGEKSDLNTACIFESNIDVSDCNEYSSASDNIHSLKNENTLDQELTPLKSMGEIKNDPSNRTSPENIKNSVLAEHIHGLQNENVQNKELKTSEKLGDNIKNTLSESSMQSEILNALNDAKCAFANDSVFSELSDNEKTEEGTEGKKYYVPYYIANFRYILETVLSDETNQQLFNEEDREFIAAFKAMPDAAQKLYVRLFQRKYKWLRINKINYPDITNDPFSTMEQLVKVKLVDSAGTSDIDLETSLELLSLPEAKTLAKHFNFTSGKSKGDIKHLLLKHCKEHKSVFFTGGNNGVASRMSKKVKQIIGPCYRMALLPRRLFTRVLMLFSLPTISEDDEEAAGGQQQQLLTLLQVNKGELVFPEYKRTRETVIFCDRDELIRYEEARQLENDILNAIESKNFELAKDLYINAKEEFEEQCSCEFAERSSSLPAFLKRYTSFHVYVRCMTQGVEALQKLRQYKAAVSLLRKLLKQKVFCQDYRGRWFDRLALNLEQHLKQPEKALEAIREGLQDPNVRVGHRYSLLTRALRVTKSFSDEEKEEFLKEAAVSEAPKVVIKGRLCPRTILGRRNVFISSRCAAEDENDVTVLGVEQLAIEHYKEQGFSEGIHGEGSTFISIYALLFWDIIYDGDIPDAFISPYQTHPLDLNSESFFQRRKVQIEEHLSTLKMSTAEDLKEIVKATWENHLKKASLVNWDLFADVQHAQGLVGCLGADILCGICERLAKDFRFTRSGVPDLVVWNPEANIVKIVEVKGPGDKLSSKQILWLDCLIKLGADAEVCLVEAIASKRLRKEE